MKLVAVIAASLISAAAFAQNTATTAETETAGLIGKRYVAAGFGWTDINHSSVEGMGTAVVVNVPVNANFDVSVNYGYRWLEGVVEVGHDVGTAVTGYITRGQDKYFASANIGYAWFDNKFGADHGIWGADAGIERAVNSKISVTTSVGYGDDFGQHREGQWDATIGGSYSFTSKLIGTASVSWIEGGSIGYLAGVAYRF